jgi:N-acetylneuraminic acid mutarotase
MKKILSTLLSILFFINLYAQVGSWATKKSLGNDLTARFGAQMVTLNSKLYILNGNDGSNVEDFTEYNPGTGELIKLEGPPASSGDAGCSFAVQGKLYSFGGACYVYDPLLNVWTNTGNLPANLQADAGFVINDTIFITSELGNYFYSYNIVTNTFTQRVNYPGSGGRRGAIAFDINGKGYFGAGTNQSNGCFASTSGCVLSDIYEYDPLANAWTPKAYFPVSFRYGSAISHNGKGYVGLGEYYINNFDAVKSHFWYEFDPIGNTWTPKQNLMNVGAGSNYDVMNAAIAKVGNDIYVFGGSARGNFNVYTDDLYKYNTVSNNWVITDDDLGKNRQEASGFYANGKIYVGSGHDHEGLTDFWEYDLTADQWTSKASLSSSHCQRNSVEINGKGYFVGGYGSTVLTTVPDPYANYIDSLLEYNPATNQWTAKASFPGGKRSRMIALSYNGKLYAGLGENYTGSASNDFREYNPTLNSWTSLANSPSGSTTSIFASFVVGDTAYLVSSTPTPLIYKYSFISNSWSTGTHSLSNASSSDYVNQGFTYNGKGYVVHGAYNEGDMLREYNPVTGGFVLVLNTPFKSSSQTIIPTPNGIYFGFGNTNEAGRRNNWRELKFNAEVSNHVGLFEPIVSGGYTSPVSCGTGLLSQGISHTVYDTTGNLFASVIATNGSITSPCFQVNSRDTLLPYQTICGNMGHSYNENGMFLNKSVLFSGTTSLNANGTLRLYFTTNELNKFVQAFNTQYSSNQTLDSIQLLRVYSNSNDINPLNNGVSGFTYTLYSSVFNSYGSDKYIELTGTINGEIYAVLSAPSPIPLVTPTGTTTLCEGGAVTLTSSAGSSYLWSPGGATTSSISATDAGTYTVTVTNGNHCPATSTGTLVTVNSNPATPTITPSGTTTFCQGGSVTLSSSAGSSYLWSPGGATTSSIPATSSGTYTVTVSNGNGCLATSSGTSVTVNSNPATPTITLNGADLVSSYATGNQWYVDGNLIPSATGQTHTPLVNGDYTVEYTDGNGCESLSLPYNVNTVGISSLAETHFAVSPNPTNGVFTIVSDMAGDYSIELYNAAGQLLFTKRVSGQSNVIDIQNYAAGVYTITLSNGEMMMRSKLIKN